jgi:hypothetical protein
MPSEELTNQPQKSVNPTCLTSKQAEKFGPNTLFGSSHKCP